MGKGGTEINYPQQQGYGESMRESLQAQIDLAPELYGAEASQQYGRPAYAQLETDILRDTLLGKERWQEEEGGTVATPQRPEGVFDVTTEDEQWEAYVNMNPDLKEYWDTNQNGVRDRFKDMSFWGQTHYGEFGEKEGRFLPEIGKTYDPATSMEYAPQMGEMVRGGGLMDLLGGTGRQDLTTGAITQKFVTRKATEDDVSAGTARYVGQEIQDGRIRGDQMIGETRDVLETKPRRPGFTFNEKGEEVFAGLAQYGSDIAEQAARRQRSADIADVQRLGGIASQAIREADPLATGLLERMGQQATASMDEIDTGQYGGLLGTLQTQAGEDLAAGRGLSPRQRREAEQAARAGWEARGMIRGPEAVVSEVESVMEAAGTEEAKRRAFAQNVLALEAARRGEGRTLAQATMGASQAMTADPFMAILGRPSGASQQIAQGGLGSAGYGLTAGPQQYSPEAGLSYMLGQQTNQANIAAAQAAANATRSAGLASGLGALGGGIAQGAIMACWIAREVYGESNPKWMMFREWLFNKAPEWFKLWYLINGEQVAEWLKDKPEMKAKIRLFMDSKVGA
jgi:hypothetical protein